MASFMAKGTDLALRTLGVASGSTCSVARKGSTVPKVS